MALNTFLAVKLTLKIIIAGAVNLTLVFYYAADPL